MRLRLPVLVASVFVAMAVVIFANFADGALATFGGVFIGGDYGQQHTNPSFWNL